MKSLKIAFSILLCVTILSLGTAVVCAVIAGNTAESFRDYRSSVITTLSSLHGQLSSTKQAFTEALARLDGLQSEDETNPVGSIPESTAPDTKDEHVGSIHESTAPDTEAESESIKQPEAAPETDAPDSAAPTALYTVREIGGRIGIFDAGGALVRTVNVPVATLPRADREQLAVGITIHSEEELKALIEDFSG
ncbi:MAG: hypothetical protein IIU63_00835 [Clostridia bacterium]|nr:hypothetical protein [Clostridia bacterium]